jgi:hypothetical protein
MHRQWRESGVWSVEFAMLCVLLEPLRPGITTRDYLFMAGHASIAQPSAWD